MSNPWFRLYAEIIDHELVGLLSFEDQRHYVWLLAMKCAGMLDKDYPSEKVREAAIARKLGLQGEALCNAKIRLSEVGLIDDDWQPRNWDKRQFRSDADPTGAERQRRHRQSKAKEKQEDTDSNGRVTRYGNATVTHQITDTDTDITPKSPSGAAAPKGTFLADTENGKRTRRRRADGEEKRPRINLATDADVARAWRTHFGKDPPLGASLEDCRALFWQRYRPQEAGASP